MGLLDILKTLAGIEHWEFSDPRSVLRIPCDIGCHLKDRGGQPLEAKIVDIGLRGLRLVVPGKVRKGSMVELASPRPEQGEAVKCRIEWKTKASEGALAGASFQDSEEALTRSWLIEELKAIGTEAVQTALRRSGVRVICDLRAKLTCKDEKRDVYLRDLGLGGALVECAGEVLKVKDTIRLDFGPLGDLSRVLINSQVVAVYEREIPRYGLKFETFSYGGVTDLERYLTYFFSQSHVGSNT